MRVRALPLVALTMALTGVAWAQAPAPSCEEDLAAMRYLVRLYGETRTGAEFEMARQRARADRAEAEIARLRALLPTGKTEGK